MKYTKKERKEIYLKAAGLVAERKFAFGCIVLDEVIKESTIVSYQKIILPEFFIFEPTKEEKSYIFFGWWAVNDRETRINALLLCAEMCND
jgi:hypothetical protein